MFSRINILRAVYFIKMMEIKYGMLVADVNNKTLGAINHIVMDSWSGEPRKFVVRLDDAVSAMYFAPENVAEISGNQVRLNIAAEEIEKT